jgi:hypothetical protein
MQLIIGTLLGVTDSQRDYEGRSWIEHTAHILDGVRTMEVTLQGPSRDGSSRGLDPTLVKTHEGERIALETYCRSGKTRVYFTATKLMTEQDVAEALGLVSV